MYKLEVIKNYENRPDGEDYDDTLWMKFLTNAAHLDVDNNIFKATDKVLEEYGGTNPRRTGHLLFETEEAALAFKLVWLT